jgi:GNAT superfamily N-acetyltransferase
MGWTFSDDPALFAKAALPLLRQEPISNTITLTVLDSLLAGHRFSDEEMTFAWYEDPVGRTVGAVSRTPPWGLLISRLPPGFEAELVTDLRCRGVVVPEANGSVDAVRRFTECWTAGTDLTAELVFHQRLFRLAGLVPPDPAPAGSARPATLAELDLVMDWLHAFRDEAEHSAGDPVRGMYADRVEQQLFWFWLDEQGNPVSMAGRNPTSVGVSRVGPVYTPPEHRQRGYAAGATAACSQHALDCGADHVVLFTDLANPTSNGVYRRLGYQPVEDRQVLRYR